MRWWWPSLLVALAACGPATTVLDAEGIFEDRSVETIHREKQGDHDTLTLGLSGEDGAVVTLTLAPRDANCWRTSTNQHACTLGDPVGLLQANLSVNSGTCALDGWIELVGGAWQLDLATSPTATCASGIWTATIEP